MTKIFQNIISRACVGVFSPSHGGGFFHRKAEGRGKGETGFPFRRFFLWGGVTKVITFFSLDFGLTLLFYCLCVAKIW